MAKKVNANKILGGIPSKPIAKPKSAAQKSSKADDAIAAIHNQPIKKLTADIPLFLHKRLKSRAANLDLSIRELLMQFIEEGLQNTSD